MSQNLTKLPSSEVSAHTRAGEDNAELESADRDYLSELRAEIDRMSGEIAEITERRIRRTADAAERGLDSARAGIQAYPWTSLVAAGFVGALAALATQSNHSTDTTRWKQVRNSARRNFDELQRYAPLVQVGDLGSSLPNVRAQARSLGEGLEKMVGALADFDPKTAPGPLVEAARKLLDLIPRSEQTRTQRG